MTRDEKAIKFLDDLGIHGKLNMSEDVDDVLVMDIGDSNKFGAIYSKLDKAARDGKVIEDTDSSNISYDSSSMQFTNDDYIITLLGDLDADTYRLTVKENGDDED